MFSFIISG